MDRLVFLDLEETVITSWQNRVLCNVERVKSILQELQVKHVFIFSFAIDNETDRDEFMKPEFKGWLETVLEVKIQDVVTVQDLVRIFAQCSGLQLELFELKLIFRKQLAFQEFCVFKFKNCECVLLDDVVPNSVFHNTDKDLIVRTIKV